MATTKKPKTSKAKDKTGKGKPKNNFRVYEFQYQFDPNKTPKITPNAVAKSFDPVNKPEHYASGTIECIDAIEEAVKNLIGIEAVLTANVIKYSWRWKNKNGKQDLQKARWYLNRLIEKQA